MALVNFIYVGKFQDLDPAEFAGNIVAENQEAVLGQVFTPLQITTLNVDDLGLGYIAVDGPSSGFGAQPVQPITYNTGTGSVTTRLDSNVGAVDVTVTRADGSTVNTRASFAQMTNGDLFLADWQGDGSMSNLGTITSIRVTGMLSTVHDRIWNYQSIDGTAVASAPPPPPPPPPPPSNDAPFFINVSNNQVINIAENTTFVVDADAIDARNNSS